MEMRRRYLLLAIILAFAVRAAWAVETKDKAPAADTGAAADKSPAAAGNENLPVSQERLASDYKDFEGALMRMRDLIRTVDPNRAALLEKALKESGDRRVDSDLQDVIDLLRQGQDQLASAARKQGKIGDDMEAILVLLRNEDRTKIYKSDKETLRKWIAEVKTLIERQNGLRYDILDGKDPKQVVSPQGDLASRTSKLSKDIADRQAQSRGEGKDDNKGDGSKGEKKEGNKGDDKKADGKKGDGKPQAGNDKPQKEDAKSQPGDGKSDKGDGKTQPGDGKSGKSDGKSQGKSQSSQGKPTQGGGKSQGKSQGQGQSQGQEGEQNDSDQAQDQQSQEASPENQDPIRKRLEQAQRNMEEAQKRARKADANGTAKQQKEAVDNLEAAKEQLEDILKQIREEEMRQLLANLIARVQEVLAEQQAIYNETVRLDKVAQPDRSHGFELDVGRLDGRERAIVAKVQDAISLLRDEGSAVAMPVAMEQAREDMEQIDHRLADGKTEVVTQNIEVDVIKELQEIVAALKKSEGDVGKGKSKSGASQDGQPQDPPLIETLAELKMIRTLQDRVNRRHDRYQALRDQGRDVFDFLQLLSKQQLQAQKVVRDLQKELETDN